MTPESDSNPTGWWIGSITASTPNGPNGRPAHTISIGPRLPDEDAKAIHKASDFIRELSRSSANDLLVAIHGFSTVIHEIPSQLVKRQPVGRPDIIINESFNDVLSRFRRFTDRTPHELSKRHDDASSLRSEFERLTREAYDTSMGYRLMWALRNESQHHQSVLAIRIGVGLGPTEGIIPRLDVNISQDVIEAARSGGKWKAAARDQLLSLPTPIDAIAIFADFSHAIEMLTGKLIRLERLDIVSAAATLQAASGLTRGEEPFLVPESDVLKFQSGEPPHTLTQIRLPVDAAKSASAAVEASLRLMTSRHPTAESGGGPCVSP